jgi:hypothetical protein
VRNFTDIDDKIIRRANQEGVSAQEISERYIAEYRADLASLGVLPADVEPKATDHIPQMITLIERLIHQGVAYPVESRASPRGRARGATAARAGTSSARRWRCSTWARPSTCTAGVRT